MNYVGIDPGKTGAIVLVDKDCKIKFKATVPLIGKFVDLHHLDDYFKSLKESYGEDIHVLLEDVHSIFGAGATANFSFGRVLGNIEALIISHKMKFTSVAPKEWQKTVWQGIRLVEINTGKKNKNGEVKYKIDTKATTLLAIKRLFPNDDFTKSSRAKKDDEGTVDACALAYYGYVKFNK